MAGKPEELQTAEGSTDLVTAETPDSVVKGTGDTVITDQRRGPKGSELVAPPQIPHKRGSGFGVTKFDQVAPDPHLRTKVGEAGHVEKNKKLLDEHKKSVAAQQESAAE